MGTDRFFLWFSILWILCILPSRTSGVGSTAQNEGACISQPCENGGTCHEFNEAFLCTCLNGFSGSRCERNDSAIEDNPYACTSNPCMRGQCVSSGPEQFTCMCSPGWVGELCDRDQDECVTPDICGPGLTCVNNEGSYFCKNLSCHAIPCQNGGTCLQEQDGSIPMCTCPDGFTGTHCETVAGGENVCNSHPCQNGGTCLTLDVSQSEFTCQCVSGFSGTLCDIPLHVVCLYDEITYHEGATRYVDCNECYCQKGSWLCTTKFCGTIQGAFKFKNSFDTITGHEDEFSRLLEEDLLNVFNIPDRMLQDLKVSPGSIKVDLTLVSLKAQYDVRRISNDLENMLSNANYSFFFQDKEFTVDPSSVNFAEVVDVTLTPTDANTAAPVNSMDMFVVIFAVAIAVVLLFVLLTCVAKICIRRHNAKAKARQYQKGETENLNNSHQVTTMQQNHLYAVIDNSSETYDDPDDVSINMNGSEYHTYERPKQDSTPNISSQTTMEYKELEFCRDSSRCYQLERDILDNTEV